LDICVPVAVEATTSYAIFTCDNDTITMTNYNDSSCKTKSASEDNYFKINSVPGTFGYGSCVGSPSYIVINQYTSCAIWESGAAGAAQTIVAANVCIYQSSEHVYTKTTCTGNGWETNAYEVESCAAASYIEPVSNYNNECSFYENTKIDGVTVKIYSSMLKCVNAGINERCTSQLATYSSNVMFEKLTTTLNYTALFTQMFPYLTVTEVTENATAVSLELGFCNRFEYNMYVGDLKNFGSTIDSKIQSTNANAIVCWNCTQFTCTNSTYCGSASGYCSSAKQCYSVITTTASGKKSASVISVSILSLLVLALSVISF